MRSILESGGAVVSEYPPGTLPLPGNFPQRNRIISGLCLGTVVVEAPKKSGSLITASLALDQGRDVFAVPANFDAASSEGCNALIQSGAKLIRGVEDITEEYEELYDFTPIHRVPLAEAKEPEQKAPRSKAKAPAKAKKTPGSAPPQTLEQVFAPKEKKPEGDAAEHDALLAAIDGVTHIDTILARTGLLMHQALAQLTLLELMGKVRQLPGKQFEKTGL